ncbi:unnamed protein product [Discula destructiva]
MASTTAPPKLPVAVDKPTPYTFDLGLLLANDPNPLTLPTDPAERESALAAVARDGAQSLINQLLTTCALTATKTDGVLLSLPPAHTPLPREKPLPTPKPPTKWEQFAKRKGIKPKTKEQRKNLVWNAETGEWDKKWGWKGDKVARDREAGKVQADWVVEVDPAKEAKLKGGETLRGEDRRQRKEKARRNERKARSNARHGAK